MSCMGGATAPLSSSSSESALGLLSDLATAWFSMDPLPSPPASGCLPVISSTAASTAVETENTSVTRQIGGRTTFWHTGTHLCQFMLTVVKIFLLWIQVSVLITGWLPKHLTDISITRTTLLVWLNIEMVWLHPKRWQKQLTLRKCASPEWFHELIHLNKRSLQRETFTKLLHSSRKKTPAPFIFYSLWAW